MDNHTPEQRSRNMQLIKAKGTSIEEKMRKKLWAEGIRYRKNWKKLPGKPDIAITKYQIAVFCDSGFWHGRDYELKKKPETNAEFWDKKIRRNIERDNEVNQELKAMGWTVLRFWDTDINNNLDDCIQTIQDCILQMKISDSDNTNRH